MTHDGDRQAAACCTPRRPRSETRAACARNGAPAPAFEDGSVPIPGGLSFIGTDAPQITDDGEGPLRTRKIKPFRMAATSVTNRQFNAFVDATGHVTDAEHYGWSFVFWQNVPTSAQRTQAVPGAQWWRRVDGANWKAVCGPGTQAATWWHDHPVVHVSHKDALAYAHWQGGRLPSEAEWEHAARGGQGDVRFPWGDLEPDDTDTFPCNIWQGTFPDRNTGRDGWPTTAPARSFAPNAYGLYNMVGNVWEWTSDPFKVKSLKKSVRQRVDGMRGFKLLKGGSFLCHRSYCYRYRIAARSGNSPDSTTTHQGFRVVWDA